MPFKQSKDREHGYIIYILLKQSKSLKMRLIDAKSEQVAFKSQFLTCFVPKETRKMLKWAAFFDIRMYYNILRICCFRKKMELGSVYKVQPSLVQHICAGMIPSPAVSYVCPALKTIILFYFGRTNMFTCIKKHGLSRNLLLLIQMSDTVYCMHSELFSLVRQKNGVLLKEKMKKMSNYYTTFLRI